MKKYIVVHGARTHNLKNLHCEIPKNQLVVITGLSGSGKSSLAFDTLYAEGQRRYVASLSAYARQFLSLMEKPDVDHIEGLSPAIAIEQKSASHNPRSTVGTVTEISDYMRLLFARAGEPQCPQHGERLQAYTVSQMVEALISANTEGTWMILAPVIFTSFKKSVQQWLQEGYLRVRLDGTLYALLDPLPARPKVAEIVVDRLSLTPQNKERLTDSLETALHVAGGSVEIHALTDPNAKHFRFSSLFQCTQCSYRFPDLEPRNFSFNNPAGACSTCDGLGEDNVLDPDKVVLFPEFSLYLGAIPGWDHSNPERHASLEALAKKIGLQLNVPFQNLSEKMKKAVLYGASGFEGVLPTMLKSTSPYMQMRYTASLSQRPCPTCAGSRLGEVAQHVFIEDKNLPELTQMTIEQHMIFLKNVKIGGHRGEIAQRIIKEIVTRLTFLEQVGLGYLTLSRSADSLSGGESQRIRLASQIGAGLTGVMYVLDEPSIGLHPRDNQKLLNTLQQLKALGNSVIVVEHDEETMRHADYLLEIGPGSGRHGGELTAEGSPEALENNLNSLTGDYLSGRKKVEAHAEPRFQNPKKMVHIEGAQGNNLKNINVSFPIGLFTCVTGVSGSGKSTLINDTLVRAAARMLNNAQEARALPYEAIRGLEHFDKVINIDQSPIGRTPRSNAATYTGLFTHVRELFAAIPEAGVCGYTASRFSFNLKGGRCQTCEGSGVIQVAMHFLPDLYVACEQCQGRRYNRETLNITYKGKSIDQVLAMSVEEAAEFFSAIPPLAHKLATLIEAGLPYLQLGQAAPSLSGGEAQRLKLSRELSKKSTGNTLYILDEPTTGLHFADIQKLLDILFKLRTQGNAIIVIEHNLDVINAADWIIDLGPEGGEGGGFLVVAGTPEHVMQVPGSYTGHFLRRYREARASKT